MNTVPPIPGLGLVPHWEVVNLFFTQVVNLVEGWEGGGKKFTHGPKSLKFVPAKCVTVFLFLCGLARLCDWIGCPTPMLQPSLVVWLSYLATIMQAPMLIRKFAINVSIRGCGSTPYVGMTRALHNLVCFLLPYRFVITSLGGTIDSWIARTQPLQHNPYLFQSSHLFLSK